MLLNRPLNINATPDAIDLNTVTAVEWRLLVERVLTTGDIWIGRLELRETVGGANVAIHGTNGIGSSGNTVEPGYTGPNGFQGGGGTDGWFTSISDTTADGIGGGELKFTFDTPRNIKQVAIRSPASTTSSDIRSALIQAKVGSIWYNMAQIDNLTQFGLSETRLYSAYQTALINVFAGESNE
jgi:hypothetical protein